MPRLLVILAMCLLIPVAAGADGWGKGKGKFGDPFFDDSAYKKGSSDSSQVRQGAHSIGVGASGSEILFETTHYFWNDRSVGLYAGIGAFTGESSNSYHAGLAAQFEGGWSAGVGVGVCTTSYSYLVHNSHDPRHLYGTGSAPVKKSSTHTTPHAWLECGQLRGVAARVQFGPAGFGGTLHARFGGSGKAALK
jgi:hypothetical protein